MKSEIEIGSEELIRFYEQLILNSDRWISRKEIAAWSAIVVYLSIVSMLTNIIIKESASNPLLVITIASVGYLLLLLVFSLFIHNQFGVICNSVAFIDTVKQIILALSTNKNKNRKIVFDNINEPMIPKEYKDLLDTNKDKMRRCHICSRILIPIALLFMGKERRSEFSTIEKEEGIIYFMMITVTLISQLLLVLMNSSCVLFKIIFCLVKFWCI